MNVKQEIIDSIQTLVDANAKKMPSIMFGVCTSIGLHNKCTVKINQIDYTLSYYGQTTPKINTKYPVFVPSGNMAMAFIITTGTSDGGGSSGVTDYNELTSKPSINGTTLVGNKTNAELNLSSIQYNTTNNWNSNSSLMSKANEIYVYTDYYDLGDGKKGIGVKIGDGKAYVIDLPFVDSGIAKIVEEHIDNNQIHITQAERTAWNNKISCYLSGTENLVFTTDNI